MPTSDIQIRTASTKDILTLQNIGRITFYESFNTITDEKDMREYLETAFSENKIETEINDPNSIFYLIILDEKNIGYGKINFNKSPYGIDSMKDCMEIQRIYLKKEYQGIGAAKKLMSVFLEQAKQRQLHNVWLSTGSFNNRALDFYKKYGFETIAPHAFIVGETVYEDVILHLRLEKGVG